MKMFKTILLSLTLAFPLILKAQNTSIVIDENRNPDKPVGNKQKSSYHGKITLFF